MIGGIVFGSGVHGRASAAAGGQGLPPDKQAILDQITAIRQASGQHSPKQDSSYIPPLSASTEWRSGIIESKLSPLSPEVYNITNQWQNVIDGKHVNVYAGALQAEPGQGVLVVMRTSAQYQPIDSMSVVVPPGSGALQITGVTGVVLTIESSSGQSWEFSPGQSTLG